MGDEQLNRDAGQDVEGLRALPGGPFAIMLIDDGLLTVTQVKKAARVQAKLGGSKLLATIFVELGMITEDEHRRVVCKHGRSFRLGDLFCELGYVSLAQLRQAEEALRQAPGTKIGDIFRQLGMVDDRQLAQALSEQLGLPLVHVDLDTVDRKLLSQFSVKFMRMHMTVPYEEGSSRVSIATSNPLHNPAIEEIERRLHKKSRVVIAAESALIALLDKLETAGGKESEQHDQVADIVDSILLAAIREGASDIHIEPMEVHTRIRLRLDGVLIHKMDLPGELAHRVVARLKVLASMDISDCRRHQDGRFTREVGHETADYRVSTYVSLYGENMVMRVLRSAGGLKNLEQISMSRGLLDRFKYEALDVPTGVILITGPTGSGKTTTLYAAIDYLNRPTTKIITVEDPVEYIVPGIIQCSVDAVAGRSFDESLKAVVRQDPDVIVMGEVRDRASAQVAVQASLTGHKVLTTFHTEDSIGGLLRLIDMGIETFLISSTVVSILAQRLIRTICPDCRQAYMPNRRIANIIGLGDAALKGHTFYRGTGCATCYGTGYHGRTALHELLVLNEDVREAILAQRPSHEVRKISCESTNLLSLMENGLYKVLQGLTTVEEVYRVVPRTDSHRTVEDIYKLMGHEL